MKRIEGGTVPLGGSIGQRAIHTESPGAMTATEIGRLMETGTVLDIRCGLQDDDPQRGLVVTGCLTSLIAGMPR